VVSVAQSKDTNWQIELKIKKKKNLYFAEENTPH
jgi:hypothetical protein